MPTAATVAPNKPTPTTQPQKTGFRYEIQALRAIAVLLVIAAHMWPTSLVAGGYIGVDVFFVISGFLITAHLWREATTHNRINLLTFYARRVRRLLPAYAVVLATCTILATTLLPHQLRTQHLHAIIASALQIENWWLAHQATDYWAANNTATSVQHYWSLSVEEQFYIFWPLAMLLALLISRKLGHHYRTTWIILATITTASFTYSIWFTPTHTAAAYFITPTRVWELGLGGLLALGAHKITLPTGVRIGLRWGGLAAITIAALTFTGDTAFPGSAAALPVLGTMAVILAAHTHDRDPLSTLARHPFTQWAGNTSYSMYLWHWPVLIFAPFLIGNTLADWQKLLLLPVIFLLADVSYRFVEPCLQPGHRFAQYAGAPSRAFSIGALITALIVGASYGTVRTTQWLRDTSTAIVPEKMCEGATAMENYVACTKKFAAAPTAELTADDTPWHKQVTDCQEVARLNDYAAIRKCTYATPDAPTLVLLGDSHAEHYRTAISEVAANNNWNLLEVILPGCSVTDIQSPKMHGETRNPHFCKDWSAWLATELPKHNFTAYLLSSYTANMEFEPANDAVPSIRRALAKLPNKPLVVARDVPSVGASVGDLNNCLAVNADPLKCATPRSEALRPDLNVAAAQDLPNARVVDLSDKFCDDKLCYAVIGGLRVHYDQHHITTRYMRTVAAYLEPALRDAMQ